MPEFTTVGLTPARTGACNVRYFVPDASRPNIQGATIVALSTAVTLVP